MIFNTIDKIRTQESVKIEREVAKVSEEQQTLELPSHDPLLQSIVEYILIKDQETLEVECDKRLSAEAFGVDVETTGLDPYLDKTRLIQIAVQNLPVMVVDVWAVQTLEPLKKLLHGPALKIFQNGKFDLKMLHTGGLPVTGPLFDTMLASQMIQGGLRRKGERSNLKDLAKKYLNIELSKNQQVSDWTGELSEEQIAYACKDAYILLELRDILREELVKRELGSTARLEFDCLYAVVELELNGFFLDIRKQANIKESLRAEVIHAKEAAMKELGDINLNSPKQLLPVLHDKTKIHIPNTRKETLKAANHPIFNKLVDFKEKNKFFKDNFERLPKKIHPVTGRIHAEYVQMGAETGRFTCKKPNLQQIPRKNEIRDCFRAETGNRLVIADYSQIELRIAAEISKDPVMIEAYVAGKDLHTLTASFISGKPEEHVTKKERQLAKALNFGLIYGAGADTLRNYAKSSYGIDLSEKEAKEFRRKFFRLYEGIKHWHNKVNSQNKYITYTLGGRYRKFYRSESFRLTDRLNSPDQGTGADILKKALVLLQPKIKGLAKLVHIVHDEIILECPETIAEEGAIILKETMEEAGMEFLSLVPVVVEVSIGDSWAAK